VEIPTLTVGEAIGQRQQLHQKKVRVRGLLTFGREHSGLRSLGGPKVIDKDGRDEIWISFPAIRNAEEKTFVKEYHKAEVEIFGTFDADKHGHMSLYAATINTIEIAKLPPSIGDPKISAIIDGFRSP
jgi:hypothetical protein